MKFLSCSITRPIQIQPIELNNTLENSEKFKLWVKQFIPHLKRIPASLHEAFLDEFISKYLSRSGLDELGQVKIRRAALVVNAVK